MQKADTATQTKLTKSSIVFPFSVHLKISTGKKSLNKLEQTKPSNFMSSCFEEVPQKQEN